MGLRKTVSALKSFSDSAWEMTNRVGKYSAEITLASAMLDAHRMMRDVRMAREIGPAAAENIRQKDRLEENMMPINAMIGRIGHFVDNLVLRFQNFALEEIINPQLGNEQEAADKAVPIAVGVGQKVLEFLGRINPALGAFVPLAEEMGKVAIAMDAVAEAERKAAVEKADREAAEAHKKAQEEMRGSEPEKCCPSNGQSECDDEFTVGRKETVLMVAQTGLTSKFTTLEYNGIQLRDCQTLKFEEIPVNDSSGMNLSH
jgi:hypothetical protein